MSEQNKNEEQKLKRQIDNVVNTSIATGFARAISTRKDYSIIKGLFDIYPTVIKAYILKVDDWKYNSSGYTYNLLKESLAHSRCVDVLQLLADRMPKNFQKIVNDDIDYLGNTVMHHISAFPLKQAYGEAIIKSLEILLDNGGSMIKENKNGNIPFWDMIKSYGFIEHIYENTDKKSKLQNRDANCKNMMEMIEITIERNKNIIYYSNKNGENFYENLLYKRSGFEKEKLIIEEGKLPAIKLMLSLGLSAAAKNKGKESLEDIYKKMLTEKDINIATLEKLSKIIETAKNEKFFAQAIDLPTISM